jgi:hypothetical protein
MVAGIREVVRGDTLLAPSVTRRLIETYTRRPSNAGPLPHSYPAGDRGVAADG